MNTKCKWDKDGFCQNPSCPMANNYCFVPNVSGVCKHEYRDDGKSHTEAFLESEIVHSKRAIAEYPEFYDGVLVGHIKAVKLFENHIRFCEHLLDMISKDREVNEK